MEAASADYMLTAYRMAKNVKADNLGSHPCLLFVLATWSAQQGLLLSTGIVFSQVFSVLCVL